MAQFYKLASVALVLSYVLDWIFIIVGAVIGQIFSNITPNKRPFSLANPDISFPVVKEEKISSGLLVVLGLAVPAAIIFVVCLFLVPGSGVGRNTPRTRIWRRKLWEWNAGWLGLGLSLVLANIVTNGVKNLIGKPRPDMLALCNPDLTAITQFAVGGYENTPQGVLLVTPAICQNQDRSVMNDAFRSFPSGHSSFSSAGLVYLSLFLAAKLGVWRPYSAPRLQSDSADPTYYAGFSPEGSEYKNKRHVSVRDQGAAAPIYLLVICIIPTCVSIYVASTRFSDFKHHGFDILTGLFLGTVTAFFSFYYYQVPLSRGGGWAFRPRSASRAFWAGVGKGGYVGEYSSDEGHPREAGKRVDNTMHTGREDGYQMVDLEARRQPEEHEEDRERMGVS